MPARYTSARFVGREDAFARLATVIRSSAAGDSGTLLIDGTAGVGTSRFIDEAIRRVSGLQEPMTVMRGAAYGPYTDAPYQPLVRALRPALEELSDDDLADVLGTATDEIMCLIPGLASRIDTERRGERRQGRVVPERRQPRLLEGVLGVLGRLGERRPVMLIIEDLHRADAGTRALVTFLARIARSHRLAIVGTYQADAIRRDDPWALDLAGLEAAPRPPSTLTLPPLTRDELARLIAAIEDERPSASVLVVVAERSGGRPLVAEELLAARRELPGVSLTSSFQDLVLARIAARSPEARRALRLLAPAGRPLRRADLAAIAEEFEADLTGGPPRSSHAPRRGDGVLDADLTHGLDEAIEYGFVREDADGLALRHELVGRAIESDLLPSMRIRHHMAVARALADQPFVAMHHFAVGLDPVALRHAAIGAADAAATVDAPVDELGALEVAIAAGSATGVTSRHGGRRRSDPPVLPPAELNARAAEAAFAAGRPVRAAAYLDAAIASTDGRRDRVRLGLLYDRLAQFRRAAGDAEGSLAARRRAVDLVPTTPSVARATVVAGLGQQLMLAGTFSEAEKLAREAIRVARACDPPARRWELHATTTLGVSLGWRADPEAALATLTEARSIAEEVGDLDELFRVHANLTTVLELAGRHEEAVEVAKAGIAAAKDAGLEAVYGNVLRGNAADSLFLLGRWEEARAMSMTALEWLPTGINFLNALVSLATVEIELSAGESAGRLLGQTLLELEAVRDAQQAVPLHLAAASFALWRGDLADARRATDLGWSLVRDTEDWILAARTAAAVIDVEAAGAAEAREGRDLAGLASARERARDAIRAAEAVVKKHGVDPALGSRRLADAWLATARACRRRVEGRDDPAAWHDVGDAWASLNIPYEEARARWREAEALLGSGAGRAGRADAKAPLSQAVGIALGLGALPLLRELRELAGRALISLPAEVEARLAGPEDRPRELVGVMAGTAPVAAVGAATADAAGRGDRSDVVDALSQTGNGDGAPQRDTFGLSGREREVLIQIARGRTNREIGERLFISQKTVGVHVGNILAKLGVSGRVEAAAVAIRLGLTEGR
ncbi:MAG TPA: LuxR C-terminal-related transcriptional regulator [Candidatus Limnocylindrales bacterium]|nr:LuxR C-terminal-related transcriptional regulator [Candidatus Limnocylindrales bacterium]